MDADAPIFENKLRKWNTKNVGPLFDISGLLQRTSTWRARGEDLPVRQYQCYLWYVFFILTIFFSLFKFLTSFILIFFFF